MTKKTVMVTGAAGFIGGETMLKLKDHGHTVIAVDTVSAPKHLGSVPDYFYQEDFSNDFVLRLLDQHQFDAIVHCAGSSLVGPSLMRPAEYYHNNFVKTKLLLDRIVDRKLPTRLIFSSSAACYGEPIMVPCQEIDPCEPISPYGESKLMIEWMLKSYQRAYGINFVAFRYFNACGADSRARHGQKHGATHIIARVLESLRNDSVFVLNGIDYDTSDGTCIRDYVHVEDLAQAHIDAMHPDIPSDVYNLGTKTGASNKEIIEIAQRITGKTLRIQEGPRRPGDPAMLTASADKWNSMSGWTPKFNLEDIISHVWKWYQR